MSQHSLISFQRHLQAQGKRPGTQDRYVSILARFLRATDVPAEAVTADHAYDFLVERGNELGLSASWFNVTFHAMMAWLEMRQLSTDLRGLRPKRVAMQPPRWFTAAEARRLIKAVDQRPFRLFFQVMLATGMRMSEVIAMRVRDLDAERPLIRIPCGKGGDGRLVTFHPTLRERLRAYWKSVTPTDVFFERRPTIDRRPVLAGTINAALRRDAEQAGFTERVSSHRFRHSFAIHSLRGGMDIVTLQRAMGHRCITSTVRYLTPDMTRPGVLLRDLGVDP
jgi:integrase/recombinase XerD